MSLAQRRQHWLAVLAFVLFLVCASAGAALAHASLVASDPPAGAVLAVAPAAVTLTFTGSVSPLAASLLSADGESTALTEFDAAGRSLTIALPELAEGTRVLSWRAISADGHPISGTLIFSVGAETAGRPIASPAAADGAVAPALWLARTVTFVALFFGAATAAFTLIAWPLPRLARALCLVLIPIGLLAAMASIGLQGLDAVGRALPALSEPEVWAVGFGTAYGATTLVQLAAFALGAIAILARERKVAISAAFLTLLAIGTSVSLSGHASAAEPQWLMRPALFIHISSLAWWVGALFPLALLLTGGRAVAAPPLIRFSRWIPYAIVPLIGSGLVLAAIQLGWPGPAWLSPYGLILAAKLGLLALLFAIASWNRWVLTAPAARGERLARDRMRRAIFVELLIVIAVLGLVSLWRFTPPPRALDAAELRPAPARLQLTGEAVAAAVLVDPARSGPAAIEVLVTTRAGLPATVRSVMVELAQPEFGIAGLKAAASAAGGGRWLVERVLLPMPGTWTLELEIRVSDFKLERLEGVVTIAP